jgi:hypothetical protein
VGAALSSQAISKETEMPIVIEGIITTENADGSLHMAPMGPVVNEELSCWELKPFQTSTTFKNLQRNHRCIFHVTDDAYLLAATVIGEKVDATVQWIDKCGWALTDACHWYALQLDAFDLSDQRAVAKAHVVKSQIQRPFFGWNRAKHAVLEAAILASRKQLFSTEQLRQEWEPLKIRVDKTGSSAEHEAFALLTKFCGLD